MTAITPDADSLGIRRVYAAARQLIACGYDDIAPVLMDYALALQGVPVQREIPVAGGCKRVKLIVEDRITAEVFRQHCKATGYAHAAALVRLPRLSRADEAASAPSTTGGNDVMRRPPWHDPEPPSETASK